METPPHLQAFVRDQWLGALLTATGDWPQLDVDGCNRPAILAR